MTKGLSGVMALPRIRAVLADAPAARRRAFRAGVAYGAVGVGTLFLLGAGLLAHLSGVPVVITFLP